jgi:hypothetical protein
MHASDTRSVLDAYSEHGGGYIALASPREIVTSKGGMSITEVKVRLPGKRPDVGWRIPLLLAVGG